MNNSVIIKGNKYGIVVVLDDKIPFAQLREDIANKFKSATKFFDKANMAVSFEGRKLSSEEERDVLDIIAANSELNIVCVIDNNEGLRRFHHRPDSSIKEHSVPVRCLSLKAAL